MPRMKHPQHGFHVCAQHEADELRKSGWLPDDGKTAPVATPVAPVRHEVMPKKIKKGK